MGPTVRESGTTGQCAASRGMGGAERRRVPLRHRAWATVVTHSKDTASAVAAVDVACCCRWFVAMVGGRAFFFVRVVGVEGLLCRCSRRGSNQPEGTLRPGLCVQKIETGTPVRIGTCMHACCVHACPRHVKLLQESAGEPCVASGAGYWALWHAVGAEASRSIKGDPLTTNPPVPGRRLSKTTVGALTFRTSSTKAQPKELRKPKSFADESSGARSKKYQKPPWAR